MTRADLVERAADALGPRITKRDWGPVADALLDAAKTALARADHIEIRGFGSFRARHRKARPGRNPKTGEAVDAPPRDVPVFRPSGLLCGPVDRGTGVSGTECALGGRSRAIDRGGYDPPPTVAGDRCGGFWQPLA